MQRKKSSVEVLEPSLQINEHLDLHEKGWVIQNYGLWLIIGVMMAGVLGLFGDGYLSRQTAKSGSTKVEYERYYRYETEMKILFESDKHISSISFSQEYLKNFRLIRFVPEFVNNNTDSNEVRYNFLAGDNKVVTVYLITKNYGNMSSTVKVNETDNIKINQFIYP